MRIITVEREYGSGGARIAEKLARRLGWKLWDAELTQEIARRANINPEAAARHDERVDPLLYRLFKVFARGSHERALPIGEGQSFDTDSMVKLLGSVIEEVAESGNSVIVGRGSPYILRKAARSSLRLTPTGVRKESLTPLGDGVLELYELTLAPGGTSGPEFYSHGGEKAGLVTFGVMRLWLEEEPHLLGEGDSFRFSSQMSHRFDNPTREPAGVLWIVSTR